MTRKQLFVTLMERIYKELSVYFVTMGAIMDKMNGQDSNLATVYLSVDGVYPKSKVELDDKILRIINDNDHDPYITLSFIRLGTIGSITATWPSTGLYYTVCDVSGMEGGPGIIQEKDIKELHNILAPILSAYIDEFKKMKPEIEPNTTKPVPR